MELLRFAFTREADPSIYTQTPHIALIENALQRLVASGCELLRLPYVYVYGG